MLDSMEMILMIPATFVALLISVSIAVNSYFASRINKADVDRLSRLEKKLSENVDHLDVVSKQKTHYIHLS